MSGSSGGRRMLLGTGEGVEGVRTRVEGREGNMGMFQTLIKRIEVKPWGRLSLFMGGPGPLWGLQPPQYSLAGQDRCREGVSGGCLGHGHGNREAEELSTHGARRRVQSLGSSEPI